MLQFPKIDLVDWNRHLKNGKKQIRAEIMANYILSSSLSLISLVVEIVTGDDRRAVLGRLYS